MGNSLLRENRWEQNVQEIPWNVRSQNFKQRSFRYFRRWDRHIPEGCFCLPWKKIHIFKARPDSQEKNERAPSAISQQDKVDQSSVEDLCYTLINHSIHRRRPAGTSADKYYENVPPQDKRPRELMRGTETEYSLLHVSSAPRHPPSPENEYEVLMPKTISCKVLQ